MVKARKFVTAKRFSGEPKEDDLRLEEEELPPLKDGDILVQALFWSVDPYMKLYAQRFPLGTTMIGGQVCKIIESKKKDYPVGSFVFGYFGWCTHAIYNFDKPPIANFPKPYLLPDFKGLPLSLALGMLGMPGNTAYFGFLEICKPKKGETVVVSGAAGAVGSHVGQIAKIKGCRVVGFAGSDDKVKWLKDELGFDAAYNYKKTSVEDALKEAAPKGVDCYFDNVGGEMTTNVIERMNHRGRVAVCGSVATQNITEEKTTFAMPVSIIGQEIKVEGFLVHQWLNRGMEGVNQNLQWIKEGKLKYKETFTEGFENMPKAFIDVLKGVNTGKAIVKAVVKVKLNN